MAQSLRDSLAEYPRIMLEAISEGWGLALTDEQTPEIVDRLATQMVNAESVHFLLRRLNDVEHEALAYVAALGQVKVHVMARKYGAIRRLGPGRLEWEAAWREPVSPAERLWFLGLIYREYAKNDRYHGEVLYIPMELRAALPPLPIELPSFHVEPADSPTVVHDEGDALARDAFVALSYIRKHKVPARKAILTARELLALHPRLAGPSDLQRLRFVLHLCTKAGLLGVEQGRWMPTADAAKWLKRSDVMRQRALWRAWLDDADSNELRSMPGIRCEDTGWRNDPVFPRQVVAEYLKQCPVAAWLTIDSFVESIHEVAPDLMRPDGDYDSWYIRDAHTGQYLIGWGSWPKVEGALIRYLLQYPLCWLGVVAVGHSEAGADPTCFMLTQQGAAMLGTTDIAPSRPRHMTVAADLQVIVPRGASWYDRFLLERFAEWMGEDDAMARYRIDAGSVRRSLSGGATAEQILAFLRRVTGNRLPPGVVRALRSWASD